MSAELGDNQSNEQKLDDPESSTNTDVVVAKEQPNNEEEVTIDREGTQATTTTTIDLPEQQEADIQDSAATGLTTDNLNVAHINRHQSSARSLNPDSPGVLAIAEDDDEPFSSQQTLLQEEPKQLETALPQDTQQLSTENSADLTANAERDGFEVVQVQGTEQKGETRTEEAPSVVNSGSVDRSRSSKSTDSLQIIDDEFINVNDLKDSPKVTATSNETTALPPTDNSLSTQPDNDAVLLLGEQAQELREKLEFEQKRQLELAIASSSQMRVSDVENSKTTALYSSLSSGMNGDVATNSLLQTAASSAAAFSAPQPTKIPTSNSTVIATGQSLQSETQQPPKRREAYRWISNLPIFAMAWSYKRYPNQRLRLACSSIRDGHELLKNTMSILEFDEETELIERTQVFIGSPSCELKFIPTTDPSQPDLIASATRELRIYSYHPEEKEVVLEAKLCPNKSYAYAGPLTSVDWNEMDPRIVGGSSIDSTCTIWDVEVQEAIATVPPPSYIPDQQRLKYKIQTQLIAHERPVHGMSFSRLGTGREYFASCGADGSVRLFDLRNLKNSTILYKWCCN